MKNRCQIVIPARLASTRLSEKLLQKVAGRTVLEHTFRAASAATCAEAVLIAVDDPRLAEICDSFAAPWIMTRPDCPSGTDRIAEVASQMPDVDVFVNVQGDEPEIDPRAIDAVAQTLLQHESADMSTAAAPIRSVQALQDPGIVKVVMGDPSPQQPPQSVSRKALAAGAKTPPTGETPLSAASDLPATNAGRETIESTTCQDSEKQNLEKQGRAIYFSRAPVPYDRDQNPETRLHQFPPVYWHHLGLYAYRRSFLQWFAAHPPSPLEQIERLEQLRAIQAGKTIMVAHVDSATPGIDTQADLDAFRQRLSQ
ncbi:3-deoxy-manno-octulosonate cytidylyltransferase [Stieleria varia]|uniref:3-deoxy-manno-octulosonate cytidylyltransferase n=1 Tax=Stieleria varia TaxID=2528005 RepID=A0A5C6AWS9_9BACT|nr:3-deoxy-manno-octulosonate cytidylyltransferase [Stieleria varia]TWU04393.1 3-deoxy-manno-octulosonate cytidylyltransferase [Stieleria varia]